MPDKRHAGSQGRRTLSRQQLIEELNGDVPGRRSSPTSSSRRSRAPHMAIAKELVRSPGQELAHHHHRQAIDYRSGFSPNRSQSASRTTPRNAQFDLDNENDTSQLPRRRQCGRSAIRHGGRIWEILRTEQEHRLTGGPSAGRSRLGKSWCTRWRDFVRWARMRPRTLLPGVGDAGRR